MLKMALNKLVPCTNKRGTMYPDENTKYMYHVHIGHHVPQKSVIKRMKKCPLKDKLSKIYKKILCN